MQSGNLNRALTLCFVCLVLLACLLPLLVEGPKRSVSEADSATNGAKDVRPATVAPRTLPLSLAREMVADKALIGSSVEKLRHELGAPHVEDVRVLYYKTDKRKTLLGEDTVMLVYYENDRIVSVQMADDVLD